METIPSTLEHSSPAPEQPAHMRQAALPGAEQTRNRRFFIAFGAWVLVALACRFVPLLSGSVWFDELISIRFATYSTAEIRDLVRFDPHPPLYYLLIHAFMRVGQWLGPAFVSTAWIRLSSVLPGLATCAILSFWAWQTLGRRAGLTALALAAVSPGLCFYAQELRNYSLAIMFVTLAGFLLLRLLQQPTIINTALYIAASLFFLYTHNLTLVIFAGNCLWALSYPFLFGARPGLRLRGAVYGSSLLIMLLFYPQLCLAFDQFFGHYQPFFAKIPAHIRWFHLPATFLYDFPAGPVETQDCVTPFGWMMMHLHAGVLLLLGLRWRRIRQRLRETPSALPPLAYCGFIALFFLGSTWTAAMLELGKFFDGSRMGMFVMPLWLLALVLLIESLPSRRRHRVARFTILFLMAPCALLSLYFRSAIRTDFGFLTEHNAKADAPGPLRPRTYYLTDEMTARWVAHPGPGLQLAGVSQMLERGQGGQVILLNASAERLQTDREVFTDAVLRDWCVAHEHPAQFVEFMNPVYTLPASEAGAFKDELERRWNRARREVVRQPDRLVLQPHCREFNSSVGFHLPEFDGDKIFRWTNGPLQRLSWTGPERPGRYELFIQFWRPAPLPGPQLDLEYQIGPRGSLTRASVATGSVLLRQTVETRTPRERISLEMYSDFYIPALWDHASGDRRQLGLMFTGLEMRLAGYSGGTSAAP